MMNKELRDKVFGIMQSVYNAGARGEGITSEKGDELITLIRNATLDEVKLANCFSGHRFYPSDYEQGWDDAKADTEEAIDNLRGD